jgi:hypothetical protein
MHEPDFWAVLGLIFLNQAVASAIGWATGGGLGLVIGSAAGWLLGDIPIAIFGTWAAPDAMMVFRQVIKPAELKEKQPLDGNANFMGIPVAFSFERQANGDLLEIHRYVSGGTYTLTFRHQFS